MNAATAGFHRFCEGTCCKQSIQSQWPEWSSWETRSSRGCEVMGCAGDEGGDGRGWGGAVVYEKTGDRA